MEIFPAAIGYDSLKQGLIGLGASSCKTELTRQIADSGAAPTKGVTIRYPLRIDDGEQIVHRGPCLDKDANLRSCTPKQCPESGLCLLD